MKTNARDLRGMTRLALLVAIEVVMAYTPLGMVPIGPINASLLTIPVAIGAMVLGPIAGALMGVVFGLTSFLNAVQGKSAMGVALMAVSPGGYFVQAVIGRLLCGLVCGLVYQAAKKAMPEKDTLCCAIGGLSCPLLNTLFYMGFMMLLFYRTDYIQSLAVAKGAANPLTLTVALVGIQGLVEAVTCCAVSTLITTRLLQYLKR